MPSSRAPPELSPMASSFHSATGPTTASVRRNLFSGHLSRRPVSRTGSQDEPQMPQSVAHPPPPPSRRIHQRSVSTPSLSPSPPRLSPTHNYQAGNGTNPPVFAHPLLRPTQSPPRNSFLDTYDPTVSPNRPLSPGATATLFPDSSIIAFDPITRKPILPHLPVLPGRLKLSDSDDEGLEIIEPGQPHESLAGHGDPARAYDSSFHSASADTDYAHQAAMAAMSAQAEAEAEADEERRGRERIERMVKDMMARQRAKVKNKSPASNIPAPPHHSHSRIGRRAQAQARTRLRREPNPDLDADEIDPGGYHVEYGDEENHSPIYTGPDIDAESDAEKEELMGLITASLRREVARADEEAWMFGDSGGIGAGGDLGFE
ncbi:hypothetical protein EDD36DRAFT_7359 [Exophiala viscosa]|uniref:Uncharacterized protein n=1 Tax=Exophiala viscosa TaxID=2486360 RepID=A0AAN6E6N8_9EURO|nr:hypothetical protein EDD36DRAFT_7359 [Exophiala viscosa]